MRTFLAGFLVVTLTVSGGCVVQHRVSVSASSLYATIPERRARGEAAVVASDQTDAGSSETRVTIKRGANLSLSGGKIRLDELERGCRGGSTLRLETPVAAPAAAATATAATTPAAATDPAAATTLAAATDPAAATTPAVATDPATATTPAATTDPATATTPAAATTPATPTPAATPTMESLLAKPDAEPEVLPPVLIAEPAEPNCPLLQYADSSFEVGHYDQLKPPPTGTIIGVLVLGGLGGAAVCEFACPEDSTAKRASDVTLIAVGSLFVGALVWAFIDCMGHWGQPGCRD